MYEFLLGLHNLLRWLVLLAGIVAVVTTLRGLFARLPWTDGVRRAGMIFTGSLHLQIVVGLLLYFVSPLVRSGLADMATAMADDRWRFFLVEHLAVMILAAVAAQLGSTLSKRATTHHARYLRAGIGYSLAMLLILYAIPWWRSLLPWG